MIGWIPLPARTSENSSAPKRLSLSVSASAGMALSSASWASCFTGNAPSERE
jgi:hypothetical protein